VCSSDLSFQVQQIVDRRVVGGSTYVVRVAGERKHPAYVVADSHRADLDAEAQDLIEQQAETQRFLAPWMRDRVEEAEARMGKG